MSSKRITKSYDQEFKAQAVKLAQEIGGHKAADELGVPSGIAGLQFLKKNIGQLTGKKIVLFAVGASPYDENAIQQAREMHFKDALSNIPSFYCRGAWDEEKMKFTDRTLCKMLQKAVAKQNPDEYEPWQKALMCAVGQKCDWTDKSYLEPLLKYIEEL